MDITGLLHKIKYLIRNTYIMHINVKGKLYNNKLHIYVIQVEECFHTRIISL